MKTVKTSFRPALALLLTVSFAGSPGAQSAGFSAADTKELATYRLTMETVKKVQAASRLVMQQGAKDPRAQALRKLEAEIEALEKKDELSDAEAERLEKLQEEAERQEDALQEALGGGMNLSNAKTLDEMEAGIKSSRPFSAALASAGLTPREYARFMVASVMAGMVAGFQKSGMLKQMPAELKAVNPENVKFMLDHEAELAAMQKEMQQR